MEKMTHEEIAMCLDGRSIHTRTVKAGCRSNHGADQRRLANMLCPFCGQGDVWFIRSDQSKVTPKRRWHCQNCGRTFVLVEPEGEQAPIDTYHDLITNLLIENGDDPLTAYDIKNAINMDTDVRDCERVFENATDAFHYLLALVGYVRAEDAKGGD